MIPPADLPKTGSLAEEFRASCRVGPRVWSLVGGALIVGLLFPKTIWVALALWLVFVFPLAFGGLVRWAMREALRAVASSGSARVMVQQPPAPAPAPARAERPVAGRVVSSR